MEVKRKKMFPCGFLRICYGSAVQGWSPLLVTFHQDLLFRDGLEQFVVLGIVLADSLRKETAVCRIKQNLVPHKEVHFYIESNII